MERVKGYQIALKDLPAGLVSALVSIPMALGLAISADIPMHSGLISAVVGGLVVAWLGGSYVAVSGPGVATTAIWWVGVATLGNGNLVLGFQSMLMVSLISGFLMYLIGYVRMTHWIDLVPRMVIRGVLASMGVWLMTQQVLYLLGAIPPLNLHIEDMMRTLPEYLHHSVLGEIPYQITASGIMALVFIIIYTSYNNRWIRILPAGVWIVVISLTLIGTRPFIPGGLDFDPTPWLVDLPSIWERWWFTPEFNAISHPKFLYFVLTLFVISWAENTSNLRAVDRLDPLGRRTDVHKEMRALGIATIVSAALGGMTVNSAIARSSVNVQSGARTRFSNAFHGIFVALIVLIAGKYVEWIIVPMLAAIVVFSGYKLAAPKQLRIAADIGWEQFVVFVVSAFVGFTFGIGYAILTGWIIAFVLQLIMTGMPGYILRNLLKPNTLLYQESDQTYMLSIKHFGNFINLFRIREKLDTVPSASRVIVDFSLSKFIDGNVLESLRYYESMFRRRGGALEIIGLDNLVTKSEHPFAPWLAIEHIESDELLSPRQQTLKEWCGANQWNFELETSQVIDCFSAFSFFSTRRVDQVRNLIRGEWNHHRFLMADVDYHQGAFIAKDTVKATLLCIELEGQPLPEFLLDKERLFDRMAQLAGIKDINFEDDHVFSQKFKLSGPREKAIRKLFTPELRSFLKDSNIYHVESDGKRLLIYQKERLLSVGEIKDMVSFAAELVLRL